MTFSSTDAPGSSSADALSLDDRRGSERQSAADIHIGLTASDASVELLADPDIALVGPDSFREPSIEAGQPVDGVAVMAIGPELENPHLVYANEGLCQLLSWRPDQLIGQSPAFLFAGDEGRGQLEAIRHAVVNGYPDLNSETGRRRATGTPDLLDLLTDPKLSAGSGEAVIDSAVVDSRAPVTISVGDFGSDINSDINSDVDNEIADEINLNSADESATTSPFDAVADLEHHTIDLDPVRPEAGYQASTILMTREGEKVPAFITAQALPSPNPGQAYVVTQFRDLRKAAAERLLADQETVIASLKRGHHLGQLCHQVSVMIERSLGVDATCWISIANPSGQLEPVINGGFPIEVVAEATSSISKSAKKQTKRIASVSGLPDELASMLKAEGVSNLWYVPVMGDANATLDPRVSPTVGPEGLSMADVEDLVERRTEPVASEGDEGIDGDIAELVDIGSLADVEAAVVDEGTASLVDEPGFTPVLTQRGAIVIATGDSTPDGDATKLLDHLAQVLSVAIDHASAESDSAYQALHDPLTQLPNRALIVDRISQAMARLERDGTSLSVLLVDIDRFKAVNDMRGVDVGDRVLIEVADRLLAAVRLGDTVGRISSDQYLVMCVATNGELDAASVARRILRSLADPIRIPDGEDLHITASIGAVVVTEADADHSPAEVISNAESALATATSVGRGQFAMFEAEHQHDVVRRHEIEQALRNAILNDELVLHYQPLVEVRSGFMIGAEALVRWERPGHGLIPPDEFIGVAEDAGLIVPLEEWVIDRVCADLATWPKVKGRSAMVSINLSARHLEVDTLVPTVIRALQRNDLKPNRVGFEITESMAILDTEAALQNLEKLAALGCRIAIDDFGIGHASLDYLRRFSMASAIKIDRSFVAGLTDSTEDAAIVKASIGMADALDLQVVAEGVETVEQLLALRKLGCRYAQGYVLSRPLPIDIVLEVWAQSRFYTT